MATRSRPNHYGNNKRLATAAVASASIPAKQIARRSPPTLSEPSSSDDGSGGAGNKRRKNTINGVRSKRGSANSDEQSHQHDLLLRRLYVDPSSPASFGGIDRLYHVAKSEDASITRAVVRRFLAGETTYSLFRDVKRPTKRAKFMAYTLNGKWSSDLLDLHQFQAENNGHTFFICFVDVLSRFALGYPLKNKAATSVRDALQKAIAERGQAPSILSTDQGTEYKGKAGEFMKSSGIQHNLSNDTVPKSAIAERFLRTIRDRLNRFFSESDSHTWIHVIPKIIASYNGSPHRAHGLAPRDVNEANAGVVWRILYADTINQRPIPGRKPDRRRIINRKKPKYSVGDTVKITLGRYNPLLKRSGRRFTIEDFTVAQVLNRRGVHCYRLKDARDEQLIGVFYEEEMQATRNEEQIYRVERILRRRTFKGRRQVLIRWYGYGSEHDSWEDEESLLDTTY